MTQEIKFTAVLIRNPKKAKSDEWHDIAHEWVVTINDQAFSYFTGLGHREFMGLPSDRTEYAALKNANLTELGLINLLRMSKATPPKLDDVLHSLGMDAEACEQSFEEWCSNMGGDTDSRKALETYLACQGAAAKLRKAGIDIAAQRERLADY